MPDDGHRYELVDGSLIVTPTPPMQHQVALSKLIYTLGSACPEHLATVIGPVAVNLATDTILLPDLVIIEPSALKNEAAGLLPLLVVEVLSPSTRHIDLTLKKFLFELAGCPNYWVVDATEPSITAWSLTDGQYGEPTVAIGTEVLDVQTPFPVTISPSQLTI